MKPPEFLMTKTADIGRAGSMGANILALVRYVTALPGEANGRRLVDGEMWWRASAPDIAQALGGGGVSPRTVSWTLRELVKIGDLVAIPAQDFYGDRANAYRAPDQPSARSDTGSDVPSADIAEQLGKIRHTTSANIADVPLLLENSEEHSVGEKARTARGTRLDPDWEPPREVVEQMHAECPNVDLRAEHRKFVDYWTDKTGKDATKVSWDGTWRNWIRKESDFRQRSGPARNGRSTADQRVEQAQALKNQPSRLELG
jgi:hypothetical protein